MMENNYDALVAKKQYGDRFSLDGTDCGKQHNYLKVNDMTITVEVVNQCKCTATTWYTSYNRAIG